MRKGKASKIPKSRTKSAGGSTVSKVLAAYKLATKMPLFLVGTFDDNVTVLSQQIRALNLAWAMIESKTVPTRQEPTKSLAIIGAGFAGLTLAAALLQKKAALDITIFEERDTLLPLQQGSDSRWLHPQIYDWPAQGSETVAAMLPVLNWTAGRASDVVVQALSEWRSLVKQELGCDRKIRLFCNTRHLQIDCCPTDAKKAQIEWVGEKREPADATTRSDEIAVGLSESFDFVVMTIGFGLEIDAVASYWRNETVGQPSLRQPRGTYVVSGQGDGALIDLLRLRISRYRQDRILEELFAGKDSLLSELKALRAAVSNGNAENTLFQRFEYLGKSNLKAKEQLERLIQELRRRLRRDTDAILRLKVRSLAELFSDNIARVSFQNALLVYLVYKCGGFAPSTADEKTLRKMLAIMPEQIIRRHGTDRLIQFKRLLSSELFAALVADRQKDSNRLRQDAKIHWSGGYFGIPGRLTDSESVSDDDRETWRKEYIPGPTAILGTTLCGAVTGTLVRFRPIAKQFRVTVHRVIKIDEEDLLQQTCDYMGAGVSLRRSAAGRTFPMNATIGLAYKTRSIVRSFKGTDPETLQRAMKQLNLHAASRKMAPEVCFVLAIPILQPEDSFYGSNPVAGVVYIDSKERNFWLSDKEVSELCILIEHALKGLQDGAIRTFDRIRNVRMTDLNNTAGPAAPLPKNIRDVLKLLTETSPPSIGAAFHFNFEHSDLTAVALAPDASVSSAQGAPHA